jgi:hypothetical protein
MTETHGWITLRYSDYHSEDHMQVAFVSKFKKYLQRDYAWALEAGHCRLITYNGLEAFTLNVQHNHKGEPFYPLDIFTWVAQESTGSYGLLYVHDDEDKLQHNEFQVYVLKRGKLLKTKDPFLSPYEEEVEQSYDADNPPLD